MTEPKWKQILDKLSEAERNLAKEILRKGLERRGQAVSEETLNTMAESAVKEARAMIRKKSKETFRGLKAGIKGFWEEFKKEAKD
jgi:Mg/Co/Ni transporter MgtE